jgi:hypothetical protein
MSSVGRSRRPRARNSVRFSALSPAPWLGVVETDHVADRRGLRVGVVERAWDAGGVCLDGRAHRGVRAVKTLSELGDRRLTPEHGAELLPLALDEEAELDEPARRAR